jgi:hypothetical protein
VSKDDGGAGETVPDCGKWEDVRDARKSHDAREGETPQFSCIWSRSRNSKSKTIAHRAVQARGSGNSGQSRWHSSCTMKKEKIKHDGRRECQDRRDQRSAFSIRCEY